jgi:D-alanine-D-alanine ligase-like ATP-grasp enzyme
MFVFNDYKTYKNGDKHISECLSSFDVSEVRNAFSILGMQVLCFASEQDYISYIILNKIDGSYLYSMAQKLEGYGRRALVPILGEFYGLKNINADSFTSMLGGNKRIMFEILGINKSLFVSPQDISIELLNSISRDKIVIKPSCESAAIDVYIVNLLDKLSCDLASIIRNIEKYHEIILQPYIYGNEVEVNILYIDGEYIPLEPIEIVFAKSESHLDYFSVKNGDYGFKIYGGPFKKEIMQESVKYAKKLGLKGISRFDYRINANEFFLFDITPNPTITEFSSTNYSIRTINGATKNDIYYLLLYACYLDYSNHLSIPPSK